MAQLVNVELSKSSNAVVVTVVGEVDRDTADVLAEGVERALLLVPEPRAVVADLSGVRLLAAAGATVLASANATCGSRGVPMLVVAPNRAVRRTLELCGLLSELHVVAEFPMATAAGLARELEDRAVMGTAVGVAMADQRRARAVLAAHARKADVTVRERTREVVPRSPGTVGKRGAGQTEEPSRLLIDLVAAAWETEPREHQDHITDLAAALKRQGHQVALHVRRTSHEPPASERTASGFDVVRVPAGPPTV
ncbi:STAS domain-containing protein, partial [Umezawaea endophytica]